MRRNKGREVHWICTENEKKSKQWEKNKRCKQEGKLLTRKNKNDKEK